MCDDVCVFVLRVIRYVLWCVVGCVPQCYTMIMMRLEENPGGSWHCTGKCVLLRVSTREVEGWCLLPSHINARRLADT